MANELNIYQNVDQFRLIIGETTHVIEEPAGWSEIEIELNRDKEYHGVDFEFSDGNVELQFSEVCGRGYIIDEYNSKGNDANVVLQFWVDPDNSTEPVYEGYLDFNTYKKNDIYIICSVKRKTFDDTIETRFETPVRLTDGRTIDNESIDPLVPINIPLHSKAIIQKFEVKNSQIDEFPQQVMDDKAGAPPHDFYLHPELSTPLISEIDETFFPAFGVYKSNPLTSDKFLFDLKSGGDFTFDLSFTCYFWLRLNKKWLGNPKLRACNFHFYLYINNTPYEIGNGYDVNIDGKEFSHQLVVSEVINVTLAPGDKVYLFGKFSFDGDGAWKSVDVFMTFVKTQVKITGSTESPSSDTTAFLIHETTNKVLQSISNKKATLKSEFLGRTDIGYAAEGCGSKNMITNGYQIRQFDVNNRPVTISFKDIVESLNAFYCIGTSYERDNLGNDYVRLERFDYFYQDVEILTIDQPEDYREETDTESIYNELEIGYAKYPDDDVSTMDEFNTKLMFSTPIISFKKKLSLISKLIGSGFAIELTRRKKDSKEDTWKYDEENFIIAVNNDGTGWKPEKDEAFVSPVTGIVSPSTAYNLRLSPKRMLLAWSKWINSCLVYKKGFDVLKNTFSSKNGDLTTQFKDTETCAIGDPNKIVVQEKSDISLGDLELFEKPFSPERIYFKAPLTWQDILLIKRCHQNQDNTGKNYGYIRVRDTEGNYQKGYLMSLKYNPVTETCTFVLKKKYANLGNDFNCTDYADWTFEQFEAATGLSPEIEQCKFNDFI